mmetsp:Transcript_34200/g.67341  ORF Transcript_34200/g.67341 Transcript_34200/m.67341 type:complete len:248 (-) Transcript_34200:493-1236(-)
MLGIVVVPLTQILKGSQTEQVLQSAPEASLAPSFASMHCVHRRTQSLASYESQSTAVVACRLTAAAEIAAAEIVTRGLLHLAAQELKLAAVVVVVAIDEGSATVDAQLAGKEACQLAGSVRLDAETVGVVTTVAVATAGRDKFTEDAQLAGREACQLAGKATLLALVLVLAIPLAQLAGKVEAQLAGREACQLAGSLRSEAEMAVGTAAVVVATGVVIVAVAAVGGAAAVGGMAVAGWAAAAAAAVS